MTTIDIHLNIGSNSGHREALIERAVAAVSSAFPDVEIKCSDIIETAPWGFESPNPFLNIGMMLRTTEIPHNIADKSDITENKSARERFALDVLMVIQEIQSGIDPSPHRDAQGRYIDRAIDIDLIAINDWVIDHPSLTLPHPRMHMRDFVLRPLAQLDPTWHHPLTGKTASQHLSDILNYL
ncbi:2-amino-4-hydroxy-6-hydroxymethyldihydropteridine diphosphokinase [uncultured Duncaniella sp.]|uniref:2-amino-4-hydroxy-6- hydroxymethyldihydropteridine diphosphokinase n=1 Tax=uncultured Duncaniella sp. TaxID=2768039 RepID=UPI0025F68084|nr:2-amino-4-hydroxy-6-hydroxymethyldihydropteridine diphosphokinase [uncultured Duncaniella sp.]